MTFLAINGVHSYARAVREALGDLPPESYAAELRASAGLPASTRRSWAAPPAELRSDAPTADVVSEAVEPLLRPRGVGRLAAALGRTLSTRQVTLSRAFLVVAYGLLLVPLIRASRPLNIFHIVFGTLLIAGAWRLLRAASTRADLPAHWVAYAPRVLGGTAVVLALTLGSRMGSAGTRYIYVENNAPLPTSTVFVRLPDPQQGQIAVPNMIGETLADTRVTLSRFGLASVVDGGETDLSVRLLTVRMEPAPGTLLIPGSVVKLVVASVSSLIPTSIVTPTIVTPTTEVTPTTLVAPVATASVTTVAPDVVPTVPVVTTIGTTAATAAVPTTSAPVSTIKQ